MTELKNKTATKSSKKLSIALIIFLVAYALRIAYIIEISDQPYFTAPAVDPEFHDNWAMDIAKGDLSLDEPFFRAPLYPYFLGAVYAIFGHDYFIIRIVQALIGALTSVLVYLLGKKVFSERIGIISGLIAASAWLLIYFEAELLIPVILLPIDLGLLLLLIKSRETDKNLYWWLSGLLFGLSLIARPNIGIIIPILIWLFLQKADFKLFTKRLGIFALGTIIPIIPVTYHNIRAGEFVLIATQGGVNFYIGNNANSDGSAAVFPGLGNIWRMEDVITEAETETGKTMTSSEVSGYYYKKGLEFIFHDTGKWFKLTSNKFLLFLNRVEISNNKNIYFSAKDSKILNLGMFIGFWLYGPLGIVGLLTFYRRGFKQKLLFWFVFLYSVSIIMFFVTARYKMPLVPIFIIFAVAFVDWFIEEIRAKRWNKLKMPFFFTAFMFVFINSNFLGVEKVTSDYSHFSLGNAYKKKGDLDQAKTEYLKTIEINPKYLQVHLNLGVIYYLEGDYKAAEKEFLREIEINHGFEAAFAYNNLGNVRLKQMDIDNAIWCYEKSLEIYPKYEDGLLNLSDLYADLAIMEANQDSLEMAKKYYSKALALKGDNDQYRYNFALVLGRLAEEDSAIAQIEEILRRNPGFEPARKLYQAYQERKNATGSNE